MEQNLDLKSLNDLIKQHCLYVPFENFDQHKIPNVRERRPNEDRIKDLDDQETMVRKLITPRGGVCYELNTAFAWLLEQLPGVSEVRLGKSAVWIGNGFTEVATHCVIFVKLSCTHPNCTFLVDVGFGDPPRRAIQIFHDKQNNNFKYYEVSDDLGNSYRVTGIGEKYENLMLKGYTWSHLLEIKNSTKSRFVSLGDHDENEFKKDSEYKAVFCFNLEDDYDSNHKEFQDGFLDVLTREGGNFTKQRFCTKSTKNGYITLTPNRLKRTFCADMNHDKKVEIEQIKNEYEWHQKLKSNFNINLR